ncbi:MAG: tRNA (guanosine(37)-N1)-methyltransferase TrmD [Gracilibacteraceae bacterium]|jgi:tRNA (guanine37-N1)-methyltransferase|nr:tRNA (guanosine(37)-N1)-methyltransferase TrmD [Gracilibacteraceae bacterium]
MKFTVFTLFPEMFAPTEVSMLKRGRDAGLITFELINFRDYAAGRHKNVDDTPYGGGGGMILKPEPLYAALAALPPPAGARRTVLLTPQGELFTQRRAAALAAYDELVLFCGHYEGFDERVRALADEEISIGDYVLTGGELAALVLVDAVSRLVPGVLGRKEAAGADSHAGDGWLEHPHYTRPPVFAGQSVPEVLLSGHHAAVARWRRKESLRRTLLRRPDLIPGALTYLGGGRASEANERTFVWQEGDHALLEELAAEEESIRRCRPLWKG